METLATLRPSDVYRVIGSLEMRFLAIVRRLPPWWTGSIMEISRPDIQISRRGDGEDFVIDGNFCSLHFLGIINTRMFVNSVCLSNIYFVNGEIVILFAKGNDRYRQPSTTYMYNKRANTHPINWLGIRKLVL